MRSRRSSEHAETVARRLELLGAEFRTAAPGGTDVDPGSPWNPGDEHTHLRAVPPLDAGADAHADAAVDPAVDVGVDPGEPEGDPAPGPGTRPRLLSGAVPGAAPGEAHGRGEVPVLPVPGRHARRAAQGANLAAFRGRIALGPAHVALVAVLVAVGLAVTAWWVLRDDPGELAAPQPAAPLVTPSGTAPGATASAATEVVVDVAGKVRRPGIVVLEPGARVVDALEAAGGPRRGVKLTGLNLARPLVDGEQIVVGIKPAPGVAASAAPAPDASPSALVNLNTATLTDLETLPGVGPVTAQAILDWRTSNGGFRSVEQLLDVDGIGEATLAELAPHVTLG